MTSKVEFASDAWLAAIQEKFARLAEAEPGLTLSICEVFTDTPRHLAQSGKISWHCRIANGSVEFAEGEVDDVDIKNIADYNAILPIARLQLDESTRPTFERLAAEAMSAGKLQRIGDLEKAPPSVHGLHNEMAAITA